MDTLAAAQRLKAQGMEHQHAEAIISEMSDAHAELATKSDVVAIDASLRAAHTKLLDALAAHRAATKADLDAHRAETKADSNALRAETKAELDALQAAIDKASIQFDATIQIVNANLQTKIAESNSDLTAQILDSERALTNKIGMWIGIAVTVILAAIGGAVALIYKIMP